MREIYSYRNYCEWCESLGIKPSTLEAWLRNSGRVPKTNYVWPTEQSYHLPNPGFEIVPAERV